MKVSPAAGGDPEALVVLRGIGDRQLCRHEQDQRDEHQRRPASAAAATSPR